MAKMYKKTRKIAKNGLNIAFLLLIMKNQANSSIFQDFNLY